MSRLSQPWVWPGSTLQTWWVQGVEVEEAKISG
jgi:hypothetical protein